MTDKQKTTARRSISALRRLGCIKNSGWLGNDFSENKITLTINVDTELARRAKKTKKITNKLKAVK